MYSKFMPVKLLAGAVPAAGSSLQGRQDAPICFGAALLLYYFVHAQDLTCHVGNSFAALHSRARTFITYIHVYYSLFCCWQ